MLNEDDISPFLGDYYFINCIWAQSVEAEEKY